MLIFGLTWAVSGAKAQQIPAGWLNRAPGAKEIEAVVVGAEHYGWPAMGEAIRTAAFDLHRRGNLVPGEGWLYVGLWADLLAKEERVAVEEWEQAILRARVPHSRQARESRPSVEQMLGARWTPELTRVVLADQGFSEAFFELVTPVDYLPGVFQILADLHDGGGWAEYGQLALAIALVYDVPPPRGWPHGQVTEEALPRRLHDPREVFRFFRGEDGGRRFLHNLTRMGAWDLKFIVDLAAPFEELRWAQRAVTVPLGRLGDTYSEIRYDRGRFERNEFVWRGTSYGLEEIKAVGGICVDQAYYATQAGKARGVPTLYFRGAGLDGRHAWFGYLDGGGRWKLDEGRYAEQQYVIGFAHDPQTWANISDYEVQFLADGFRRLSTYRESRVHGLFAQAFLTAGLLEDAERAARRAVTVERRNLGGWELLLEVNHGQKKSGAEREGLLREAAGALRIYTDLYARFLGEAVDSLRKRGETAEADREEEAMARRFRAQRSDLTMQLATNMMERAMEADQVVGRIEVYNRILRLFGRGAGIELFDSIVRPFVGHLMHAGLVDEAKRALEQARRTLNPTMGSQLDTEMRMLGVRLK